MKVLFTTGSHDAYRLFMQPLAGEIARFRRLHVAGMQQEIFFIFCIKIRENIRPGYP